MNSNLDLIMPKLSFTHPFHILTILLSTILKLHVS